MLDRIDNYQNMDIAPEHLKKVIEGHSDDHKIKAAQDFEAIFIQQSLKQMRPKMGEGILDTGMAGDMFYDFLDQAVAKEIAKSQNNFGIADQVLKQSLNMPR